MKELLAIALVAIAGYAFAKECPWHKADILVLVDMKRCLGQTIEDHTVKPFLATFIKKLKADAKNSDVRLGIVSYGGRLEVRHAINGPQTQESLLKSVEAYKFEPGMMTLDEALDDCVYEKCFPSWDDKGRKKVLIVATDGRYERIRDLRRRAVAYSKKDVTLFAYGIDFHNSVRSLGAVGESAKYTIDMGKSCDFNDYSLKLVRMIQAEQCQVIPPTTPPPTPTPPPIKKILDIAFVIDASSSLTTAQWKVELSLAKSLINNLVVGKVGARFAAITFNFKTYFGFDWIADEAAAKKAIDGLKFTAGGATFTGSAIDRVAQQFFGDKYDKEKRPNVKATKVIVVITDGAPSREYLLKKAVANAVKKNIALYAIGVGPGVTVGDKPHPSMLLIVNNDASHVFVEKDFNKASGQVDKLLQSMKNL